MKKAIVITALIAGMTILSVPTSAQTMYVNDVAGLRVRSEPNTDSEILRVLPYAEQVDGDISDGWMRIEDGYVCCDYLQSDDPLEDAEYLGEWRVTAYAATGNLTASGTVPQVGWTLAANDLPFGSIVFIPGYGTWRVEDRGPQSLGSSWCDLFLGDMDTCVAWGDKYLDVYLINEIEQ